MVEDKYDKQIRDFIAAWDDYLHNSKIKNGQEYWKQLMREVNIIFPEVTRTISQGSGKNAGICGSIYTESGQSMCRSRCMHIANIMLYIRGYNYNAKNGTWNKREVRERTRTMFHEYLRCTLGTAVLLQLYGNNADHREVITKVEEQMRQTHTSGKQHYEPGVCEGQHYGEVIFGLRGIGPSIKTKLHEWNTGLAGGHAGTTRGTGKQCAWAEQDTNQNSEDACNAEQGHVLQDHWLMGRIRHWTDMIIFARVKKVLDDIHNNGGSKEKCAVEKKIKEGVQKVKATVNPPPSKPGGPQPAPAPRPPTGSNGPAKPAPAKPPGKDGQPVAVTPASPPSSSGPGTKQATGEQCDWKSVLQNRHHALYVVHGYDRTMKHKMDQVLNSFVAHMQQSHENIDELGVNCENKGWNDFEQQVYTIDQTVGDVMRCRLMNTALYFANGWNANGTSAQEHSQEDADTINMLRCEIVNTFGHLLRERYCPNQGTWKRGIEYAWEIMNHMVHGSGTEMLPKGPVTEKKCTQCGYRAKQTHRAIINGDVAEWLISGGIMEELGQIQGRMGCTDNWETYIKRPRHHGKITGLTEPGMERMKEAQAAMKEDAIKIVKIVGQKIQEEINKHIKEDDATKPEVPRAKVPEVRKEVVPEETVPSTTNGENGVARSDNGEQGPVPQPPPVAPPSTPGAASAGGKGKKGKSTDTKCNSTVHTQEDRGTVVGSYIKVTVSTPDTSPGCTGEVDVSGPKNAKQEDAAAEPATGESTPAATTQGPAGHPGTPSASGPTVDTNVPGSSVQPTTSSTNPDHSGKSGPQENQGEKVTEPGKAQGDTGRSSLGGWTNDDFGFGDVPKLFDDPPPPTPPKPNPNPAQASGNNNSIDGVPSFDLDNIYPSGIDKVGGGFVPPTLPEDNSRPQNDDPGGEAKGPFFPDLNAAVLTATTPVLFFLASVIVALLGYSLWKYFAYLAKRRRTYRTVRDVPSPPLDEDILDHLQRGELPPPDYGYTMVTQPASTSGRGRPPRVHKRTIIDLHLEVLNECAATAWENVKEHYLQIVVQEFARDLDQDGTGYSSSLDAPSTNQALSGTNASSTDSEQTDRSPPNEDNPDPWSCMKNIQFATDTSPPTADDPDPWSCMETMQLQTHPCPPNEEDPDPWNCIQYIQLATHPCPPHDPDPWSCMETIPLVTGPSASNAEDPDPWSYMETIDPEKHQRHVYSHPGDATSDCIGWINWIDSKQHLLQDCTTQPWFNALKLQWQQYLREHMVANDVSAHREFGEAATRPMKQLRLWKKWVAQQHRQMRMYSEEEWFTHLLNNVEEDTESPKGDIRGVEQDLAVENVMAAQQMLRVRDVPRSQLHQQPHMKKRLRANIWILILALIIEECEFERSVQDRELYLDDLLEEL
ncbi:hypothetical protein AK88_04296 [Plasmodium fragile]|uniref:Schizont-infected cell agglutination C-terminal domain-containing protein n=1 Tax=Plasmodium fragile TaxID=5857 RepID=A0A0D9QG93_PLAFR|nr:uncharacterized protein AK88_04296 [Plasmodium fragile]KJP86039.1 hypothetical protein AK88_04296 [Plasmodium fragile]